MHRIEEDIFSDIYVYDKAVKEKIQRLIESEECRQLIEKASLLGGALPRLDEMVPDIKNPPITGAISVLSPFDTRAEYRTKEDYLQYLKHVYGFSLSPFETPPGRILGTFFPTYKRSWSPSPKNAFELLRRFYVEVKLIEELTPQQWKKVSNAKNPEAMIAKLLYKTRFKGDFEGFLRKIPWILSYDVYGSPGLDLVYRRAPGQEMPKKAFGVGVGFLRNLVSSSLHNQAYTLVASGDERKKLRDKMQITGHIKAFGSVSLDSFVGVSKIERDFVMHRHIVIWQNPGFERYQKSRFIDRLVYAKPSRFLCIIREEALPLEISFIGHNPKSPIK